MKSPLPERRPELPVDQKDGEKICSDCGVPKSIDDFPCSIVKDKIYHKHKCSTCAAKYVRNKYTVTKYQSPNKKLNQYSYKYRSADIYDVLFERQEGKCALCKELFLPPDWAKDAKTLQVDHDHYCCPTYKTCGYCLRGLLCKTCNVQLGVIEKWIASGLIIPTDELKKYLDGRVELERR